jgi:hypothetical protein
MRQTFLLQLGRRPATGFATMQDKYDHVTQAGAGW